MNNNPAKSDWKQFREIRELALDRLCQRALKDMVEMASDPSSSNHEKYLAVFKKMNEYDDEIASAFNQLSRSRMMIQLAMMQKMDLLEDSEKEGFTQETRDQLKRFASI